MNQQLPIEWTPTPSLAARLRTAAGFYLWLAPLLREAADRIECLERGRR